MSVAYCLICLERIDNCECKQCGGDCEEQIFGELRVAYVRGYRDGKAGKEMDI